jgi:2-haloacid dehalogenase
VAPPKIRALLFDVFGTVVDWRGGIISEARALAGEAGQPVDWGTFADRWRTEGYLVPIAEIGRGTRPYEDVEVLLARTLDRLVAETGVDFGADALERLTTAWRRLDPWPDVLAGLARLKERFVIAPLSNGSFALLTAMAKRAGLPWDCIVSTELFGSYKPDPATYRGAVRLLDLESDQVMLVAAHLGDLRAAATCGLRTAYVPRPLEWGPDGRPPESPDTDIEVVAEDFSSLADQLGTEADAH